MSNFFQGNFYSPSRGNLTLEGVMEEIVNYMAEKPEKFYDIVVGCDSSSSEEPHFPVAVVILEREKADGFFLKKLPTKIKNFTVGIKEF